MTWQQQAYTTPAPSSSNISICQHSTVSQKHFTGSRNGFREGRVSFMFVAIATRPILSSSCFVMIQLKSLRDVPLRFVATNKREPQSSWVYMLVRWTSGRCLHCMLQQLFSISENCRMENALISQQYATHEPCTFLTSVYAGSVHHKIYFETISSNLVRFQGISERDSNSDWG
jgi:hypothetical protein